MLNIFDRTTAVSMVLSSANQFTAGANSALDPKHIKNAMQWDMWNPWARWYELHSTHPLAARRLEYLGDQAAALGQAPVIVFDRMKPESYWDEFAADFVVMATPFLGALTGLDYAFRQVSAGGNWQWTSFGLAVALCGLGSLIKSSFRYRRGEFSQQSAADLLGKVKVSPVRPVPATISGAIIGKGVPGLIYSENFVLRDESGIIFLDFRQPLAIWNLMFGLLRAGAYQNTQVRVTGWFCRALVPYFDILRLENPSGGKPRTCYSSYANYALGALMLLGGITLLALK